MYDRLTATLGHSDIDEAVTRAIVLQLVGAPTRSTELGADIRGDIHLAIVSDTAANFSHFFSAVIDLAPLQTAHLNGTNTTMTGILGSVSDGDLSPGPLLCDDVELTVIEQLNSLGEKTHNAFQQIVDTGSYSFATANYRKTVSATGSILLGVNPKYGQFDGYEPIAEQLNLTPALLAGVDLPIINLADSVTPVQTSEDSLPSDLARQYLAYARSIDPTLTDGTVEAIDAYLETLKSCLADDNLSYRPGITRLQHTLTRFALAYARLRLSDQTSRSDTTRVITLVDGVLRDLGVDPDIGDFDADVVETGVSKTERDRSKNLKQIVAEVEREYPKKGAPIEEVIDTASRNGITPSHIDQELEALLRKAEIYEPREDHLRII